MEIIQLHRDRLEEIRPLWEALNQLHHDRSENFSSHFKGFTFEDRTHELMKKTELGLFAAGPEKGQGYSGYCIAFVENGTGEIDSIYIAPDCQGKGLGQLLMDRALDWLDQWGCAKTRISVAQGNEQALAFYDQWGFKQRFVVLEKPLAFGGKLIPPPQS